MPRPDPDQPVVAPSDGAPDRGYKHEEGFSRGKAEVLCSVAVLVMHWTVKRAGTQASLSPPSPLRQAPLLMVPLTEFITILRCACGADVLLGAIRAAGYPLQDRFDTHLTEGYVALQR